MSERSQKIVRYSLGVMLAFAALNALGGGYYAITGASGVPTEWLAGSPFRNYFVPGLVLFFVVGGGFVFATIAVFRRLSIARAATLTAVAIVFVWLVVQVAIIGYVSWMQPVTAFVALMILSLASFLPKDHIELHRP
jgi:hypothetical protein